MSDLHLESQSFDIKLPKGEVLILAGDICNAKYLAPERRDKYSRNQKARINGFIEEAVSNFERVLFIAGNHEHYDGVFDDTVELLEKNLKGVTVLNNSYVDIVGVRFFGTTLWTNFKGRSQDCMDEVRRNVGDFLLVKKRVVSEYEQPLLKKFQPEDALCEFDKSMNALRSCRDDGFDGPIVVISHHAPSFQGLNLMFRGNGLDGAFASDLEIEIGNLSNVPFWIHGHTHIQTTYCVGETKVLTNCRGFDSRDRCAETFSPNRSFQI